MLPADTALLDAAFQQGRAGDLLLLALEASRGEQAVLLRAAHQLRNLIAYPAVLEVCDRLLEREPDNARALELKAMMIARLRPDDHLDAYPLLVRAARTAERDTASRGGEAYALQGRLHKQAWRAAWFRDNPRPSSEQQRENRARASTPERREELLRALRAYQQAFAKNPSDVWPAINAITLVALNRCLHPGASPEWPPEALVEQINDTFESALAGARTREWDGGGDEEAYWVLASQAELHLVTDRASVPAEQRARVVRDFLRQALGFVGPRLFPIDSTLQQFRMMAALGFRPEAVGPALEVLEQAWASAHRPDLPRTRVVFSGHMIDAPGRAVPRFRPEDEAAVGKELRRVAAQLVASHGDMLVYLSGASGGDILFAEACEQEGIPFVLHLPFSEERFLGTSVRPSGPRWERRYRLVRDASLRRPDDQLGEPTRPYVLPDHLGRWGEESPYEACNRWMLASARAYGGDRVVLVVLWDGRSEGDGPGGTRHLVEEVRRRGGIVVHVPTPLSTTASAREAEVRLLEVPPARPGAPHVAPTGAAASPGNAEAALALDPAESPLPAEGLLETPPWLLTFSQFVRRDVGGDAASRWSGYERNPVAWRVLGAIDLRFEPIEVLTPKTASPSTEGFEVLAMLRDGRSYKALRDQAFAEGIDPIDLDLAILACGLKAIRHLRQLLQEEVDRRRVRTWEWYFTLNLNHGMIRSPLLRPILQRYYDATVARRVQLELSEDFPEELRTTTDESHRRSIVMAALSHLRALVQEFGVELVLDDSDQLDPGIRYGLHNIAKKAKADARHTMRLLDEALGEDVDARAIIAELAKFRVPGIPHYVLEGVGTRAHHEFLVDRWPQEDVRTGMQGWAICLHPALPEFFRPMNADQPDRPGGYRLRGPVLQKLGLR